MRPEREKPHEQVRRLVVAALRDPAGVLDLPPRDLDLTLRLMRRARLLGRLAADLRDLGRLDSLPPVIADQLYSALVVAEARARVARWELDRIAWALRDLPEVPVVALKGCAYLLAGTPNARGRVFADADLLVPEADLPAVEACLRRHGWRSAELSAYDERYYREWAHEIPPLRHPEREVEVDVHHSILMRTARLKPSSALLFEAARPVPGSRFKVLAPEDMVLHAIVHLFWGGEMDDAIREVVDVHDLIEIARSSGEAAERALWVRAGELDLVGPARLAAGCIESILGSSADGRCEPGCATRGRNRSTSDRFVLGLMICALFPAHPEYPRLRCTLARLALYARSHWSRMPLGTLAPHLLHKAWVRRKI